MSSNPFASENGQDILREFTQGLHDATATRYLSCVGLVLLLYDHSLTFSDEVHYVWRAKPSFAKRLFLFNRYAVALCLSAVAYYTNHYTGEPFSDETCKRIFGASSLLGVTSIGIANVLVLLRVVTLWDRNRRIMVLLSIGFVISFTATFSLMITAIATLLPTVVYSQDVRICFTPEKSKILAGVWASPMLFEILVLTCVCWNAADRPRGKDTPFTRVLQRDGITFFLALTVLRSFNLVMAAVARPTLVLVGVFFVWGMTTFVLNRSLLNIQKAACARRVSVRHNGSLYCCPSHYPCRSCLATSPCTLSLEQPHERASSAFGIAQVAEPAGADEVDGVDYDVDTKRSPEMWEMEQSYFKDRVWQR